MNGDLDQLFSSLAALAFAIVLWWVRSSAVKSGEMIVGVATISRYENPRMFKVVGVLLLAMAGCFFALGLFALARYFLSQ